MSNDDERSVPPSYGPLVSTCKRFGIGRTKAFELANEGLIETFTIGRRRYVKLHSLQALPDTLRRFEEHLAAGDSRAEASRRLRDENERDALQIRYPSDVVSLANVRRKHRR